MSKIIGVTVGTPTSPSKIENELKPVSYTEQTLTEEQKAQARANIGACDERVILCGDTLTWDGNTDCHAVVEYTELGILNKYVHVSDVILTLADVEYVYDVEITKAHGNAYWWNWGETYKHASELCAENQGIFDFGYGDVISVPQDMVGKEISWVDGTVIFPKAGIYFNVQPEYYITSFCIPWYQGFECRLDQRLLPQSVATKEYVDATVGDIESALDSIIAIQNSLIGGESV